MLKPLLTANIAFVVSYNVAFGAVNMGGASVAMAYIPAAVVVFFVSLYDLYSTHKSGKAYFFSAVFERRQRPFRYWLYFLLIIVFLCISIRTIVVLTR
ncbi:hypothetical protein [Hahella sp. HN01]|uniref:hypothetical protein n=1 Tax=Hahella sp. HN01 TaxID=2847262 RepID=UPI001C1EFD59|nr:hypothetical protein [Hahella sp. HN01]MBU6953552.1 hypothetical protein [Hahella sp. HN01]